MIATGHPDVVFEPRKSSKRRRRGNLESAAPQITGPHHTPFRSRSAFLDLVWSEAHPQPGKCATQAASHVQRSGRRGGNAEDRLVPQQSILLRSMHALGVRLAAVYLRGTTARPSCAPDESCERPP